MKRLMLLSLFLLMVYSSAFAQVPFPGPGMVHAAGGQAAAWFGNLNSTVNAVPEDWDGIPTLVNNNAVYAFTCPGTGARTVTKLSAYICVTSSSHAFRMALYNTSYALLGQWSVAQDISATSLAWVEEAGLNIPVTGGTNYVIAVTSDNNGSRVGTSESNGAASSFLFHSVDLTGGFPNPMSDPPDRVSNRLALIKAYVE